MKFQIIAITILLSFYGCYFAKMFEQRKKGIETNQLGRGKAGAAKWIEMTMKVAAYIVPIAEIMSIVFNVNSVSLPVRVSGAAVGTLGVAVFITSVLTMRDSWRAGVSKTDKTELVTKGIYQFSRNPAFLGFDLLYIGIVMMFFHWPLLIVSVFAILIFHLQIVNVEERFLLEAFGDEYLCYKKKVCRYFGRKIWR